MTTLELTKWSIDYLTKRGWRVWRNNTGRRGTVSYGKKGSGDIVGYKPDGKFATIEIKNPETKDQPTEDQINFMTDVRNCGGFAMIMRDPGDLIKRVP